MRVCIVELLQIVIFITDVKKMFTNTLDNLSLREHVGRTWYNIVRYYTSADLRPTRGRTISLANHAHAPEGTCQKDMV